MGTPGNDHAVNAAGPTADASDATRDDQVLDQGASAFDVVLDCCVGTSECGGLPREAVRAIWSSAFDAAPYVVRGDGSTWATIAAADGLAARQCSGFR